MEKTIRRCSFVLFVFTSKMGQLDEGRKGVG